MDAEFVNDGYVRVYQDIRGRTIRRENL